MDAETSQGFALLEGGDLSAAMDHFNQLIKQQPSTDSLIGRARTHWAMGNLDPAKSDFLSAHQRDGADSETLYYLGLVHRAESPDEEGHRKAIPMFDRALQNEPQFRGVSGPHSAATILVERGFSKAAIEDAEAAAADFDAAVSTAPDWWLAHFGRGMYRGSIRDYSGAVDDFEMVINDVHWGGKQLMPILNAISNLKVYEPEGTLRLYQQLAANYGNLPSVQRGLAFCFEKTGQPQRAVTWAERSLAQEPHNYSREIAARSYEALGDYYKALKHWNALIESRPDYAYAISMRDHIEQTMADRGLRQDSEVEDDANLEDLTKIELVALIQGLSNILMASPSRLDGLRERSQIQAFLKELHVLGENAQRGVLWKPRPQTSNTKLKE